MILTRTLSLAFATGLLAAASGPRPVLETTASATLERSGVVSSEYSEIRLAVSPDGRTLVWGSSNRPGGPGHWDLWRTRRGPHGWGAPEPIACDSDSNDFDPAFSPDGSWLYFFSNRPGGLGGDDLWRAPVRGGEFGAAEHLGPEVNSAGDEWAPTLSPDGRTLLFATDGRGGAGRHDLFVATARGNGWAPATPVPGALNSGADEFDATFLEDGTSIVFSRSPDLQNEPARLWFASRGSEGYDAGTALTDSVNVEGGYTMGPSIARARPGVLFFSSHRTAPSAGRMDVYEVRYRLRRR